jgi:hypothetical protein
MLSWLVMITQPPLFATSSWVLKVYDDDRWLFSKEYNQWRKFVHIMYTWKIHLFLFPIIMVSCIVTFHRSIVVIMMMITINSTSCAVGEYNTVSGSAGCTKCGQGSRQSSTGATFCYNCTAGYYIDSTGASDCLPW